MKRNRMRRRGTGKRIDVSAIREVLQDGRSWLEIGVVVDDGGGHYEVADGGVYVDVELLPDETEVRARLMSIAGGPGDGVWRVPDVGTIVVVGVPGGELEDGGIILGTLSSGDVPDGVTTGQTVIVAPSVLVYDSAASEAKELAYKSDVQECVDKFNGHVHADPASGFTGGPLDGSLKAPISMDNPDGTSILKAK